MEKKIISTPGNRIKAGRPTVPLLNIFPIHDEEGNNLTDFMMIMPGFKNLCQDMQLIKIKMIRNILDAHKEVVVFADLNLRLNSLMVSVRPIPGITLDLPMKIHAMVPEAKLVSADLGLRL